MAEKKKTMTKDEIIMELIKLLKENDKQKQAADVFEFATYVDMMENKLDQMTNELTQMRKELQEIKEQQISKSLKETLSDMANRIQVRCQQMKNQLFEVKAEMRNKAFEIVKTTKQMGKEALNKVSEFLGVKKKLMSMKEHVKEGINETDQILARIDGFSEGMRMANQQLANSFRILAGKEQLEEPKKESTNIGIKIMKRAWEWQKEKYQNFELQLDAAIDKVNQLAVDVEMQKMEKKWDEIYDERNRKEGNQKESSRKESTQKEGKESIQPKLVALVSEKEYEYGSEAFDDNMKEGKGEIAIGKKMKEVGVQKTVKMR